jgi:UV excision repair protein RAD23
MADQAETTFLKNFVGVIANQPISYPDDFQAPPEQSLRKIPVLPVCFLAPWTQQTSVSPISFIFW